MKWKTSILHFFCTLYLKGPHQWIFLTGVPVVFLTVWGCVHRLTVLSHQNSNRLRNNALRSQFQLIIVSFDQWMRFWEISLYWNCPKCHLMQVWKHFFDTRKCFCEARLLVAISVRAFSGLIKMHLMHHCNCLAFKKYNITISGSGFTWTPLYTQSFLSRNNLEFLSSHSLFLEYICLFTYTYIHPPPLLEATTWWLQTLAANDVISARWPWFRPRVFLIKGREWKPVRLNLCQRP